MSIDYSRHKFNSCITSRLNTCNCCMNQFYYNMTAPFLLNSVFGNWGLGYYSPAYNITPNYFGGLGNFSSFGFGQFPTFDFNQFIQPAFNNLQMPTLEFNLPKLDFSSNKDLATPNIIKSFLPTKMPALNYEIKNIESSNFEKEKMIAQVSNNDSKFSSILEAKGVKYNPTLGHGVAKSVITNSTGTTGACARFVNDACEENSISITRDNHAYTRAAVFAGKTEDFTEVKINNESELTNLPAGSIVVYGKGACGYSSEHGHVAIATGNGGLCSDHIQSSIKFAKEADIRVFIPTKKKTDATA